MAKQTGKWSKTSFWLELAFVVILSAMAMWKGPDRFDFIIALLVGFVWGARYVKEPCIFKRMILRKKCDCCK
ncbi:hypothetical protein BIZ83_gp080 [Erwinia phage vB_EamM_ChrisDB]|uniref:hypothetical protein n=1 Tax=Erwinia phage vB_EamM_ChrisDB TaxID=1883371 RepID=UPI00081D106B|nr:hypothetical protein BIZ83_gp080 [Erwinia phage vB_EamM_ChrisDB]ANZ48773.1 hypothetical protein CHRISDB_211 [Erwinia phage vB_EamM_ChrisDB]